MLRPDELRQMTIEELELKAASLEEELFNLRMRHALGQVENPMQLRNLRRDIARVKTIINEKRRQGRGK